MKIRIKSLLAVFKNIIMPDNLTIKYMQTK